MEFSSAFCVTWSLDAAFRWDFDCSPGTKAAWEKDQRAWYFWRHTFILSCALIQPMCDQSSMQGGFLNFCKVGSLIIAYLIATGRDVTGCWCIYLTFFGRCLYQGQVCQSTCDLPLKLLLASYITSIKTFLEKDFFPFLDCHYVHIGITIIFLDWTHPYLVVTFFFL